MKKLLPCLLTLGIAFTVSAADAPKANPQEAQKIEALTDKAAADVKSAREELQKDRTAVVAAAMRLADKDTAAFWETYTQYRAAMQPVGDAITKMVVDYAMSYGKTTDEQAAKLLDSWLANLKQEQEIKAAWVPKFRAKLPAKTVMRFFQVDNKIDAIIRFQLAAEVPLVE